MARFTPFSFLAGLPLLLQLSVLLLPATPLDAQESVVLADEGATSRYRIVVPATASPHEQKAASVLQDYLLQISGAALPIVAADKSTSPYEIVLGQNERLDQLNLGINLNELKEDGFVIRTDGLRLVIAGGNGKGTLYGRGDQF